MFDQSKYIADFNKKNYKVYSFRIKRDEKLLLEYMDSVSNKNSFITSLIKKEMEGPILTLKEIRNAITPILHQWGINEIYLFGSYSRGEATAKSDVDIYCDSGNVKGLYDVVELKEELEAALSKKVDLIFTSTKLNDFFMEHMKEDLIKLC